MKQLSRKEIVNLVRNKELPSSIFISQPEEDEEEEAVIDEKVNFIKTIERVIEKVLDKSYKQNEALINAIHNESPNIINKIEIPERSPVSYRLTIHRNDKGQPDYIDAEVIK